MTNFVKGTGRLSASRYDFQNHISGDELRHPASAIDVSGDAATVLGSTVQESLTYLAGFVDDFGGQSQGFIAVGDGYDTYYASDVSGTEPAPNENSPYDSTIPALNLILDSVLNNVDDPAHHRIRAGGIVLIKAGTYAMDDTVDIPAGIIIIGEGYGTKIINRTSTQKPLFKIKQDLNRTNDKAINSTTPFIYSKQTVFHNFVIADNFVEPKFVGDLTYKTPKNTDETAPLIQIEAGASFTCSKMKLVGRVTYTGSNPNTITGLAIGINNTVPVATGTELKIQNCDFDGFAMAISYLTKSTTAGSGTAASSNDSLIFKNNKVRCFGKLNGSTTTTDYKNNSFIKTNICRTFITNNEFVAYSGGYIGALIYCKDFQSGLGINEFSTINISGNIGVINNSISTTPDIFELTQPDGFDIADVAYLFQNNNTFSNVVNGESLKTYLPTWTVTVGDGEDTFGDFNGKNGIKLAVDYLVNNTSLQSATILVKTGAFEVISGTGVTIPSSYNIGIIGANPKETRLVKQSGGDAIFTIQSDSKLTLKNIYLESPDIAGAIDGYGAFLEMENVQTVGVPLRWVDGPSALSSSVVVTTDYMIQIKNCKMIGDADNHPLITFEGGDGNTHNGIYFDKCILTNGYIGRVDSCLVKFLLSTSYDPDTVFSNVWFTDCIFETWTATLDGDNFTDNPSILDLDMNGVDPSTPMITSSYQPILTINDIHFINCKASCPQGASAFFHTIPVTNGTNYGEASTNGFIQINEFEIDGGSYICDIGSRLTSPVTIILPYFNNTKIKIRNANFGFASSTDSSHGTITGDNDPWFKPIANIDEVGWMNLIAQNIEISNISFKNMNHKSESGEIYAAAKNFNINGILTDYTSGGAGVSGPKYRYTFFGTGNVSGLRARGVETVTNSDWASVGVINLKSQYYNIDSTAFTSKRLCLRDCEITGFTYNTGANYTDKIIFLNTVQENPMQIAILNCDFRDFVNCIYYSGSSGAGSQRIGDLQVSGSRIETFATSSTGILIANGTTGTLYFEKALINNNIIAVDTAAINIYGNAWNTSGFATITGNSLRATASSGNTTIYIRDYGSSNLDRIHGQVHGNDCGSGSITLQSTSTMGDGDYTPSQVTIRGCETGYASVSTKNFTSGAAMVHNTSKLILA